MTLLAMVDQSQPAPPKARQESASRVQKRAVKLELQATISDSEQGMIDNAIDLPRTKYPGIKPIRGTIAHKLKLYGRSPEEVLICLLMALEDPDTKKAVQLQRLVDAYQRLDEFSKQRHDVYDHLCVKCGVNQYKFWGYVAQGAMQLDDEEMEIRLIAYRRPLVDKIFEMSQEEGGFRDRQLLAEILKIRTTTPLVAIQQNTTNNTQNNIALPKFNDTARRVVEAVARPLELPAAQQEFVDAEVVQEEEKVCLPVQ